MDAARWRPWSSGPGLHPVPRERVGGMNTEGLLALSALVLLAIWLALLPKENQEL